MGMDFENLLQHIHKNSSRKSAAKKPQQKNCDSGFMEAKPWQQNTTRRKKGMVLISVVLNL